MWVKWFQDTADNEISDHLTTESTDPHVRKLTDIVRGFLPTLPKLPYELNMNRQSDLDHIFQPDKCLTKCYHKTFAVSKRRRGRRFP